MINARRSGQPRAVQHQGHSLARLINRDTGKGHGRANRGHKGIGKTRAGKIIIAVGADIEGHRPRPVPGDQVTDLGCDLVDHFLASDRGQLAVSLTGLGVQKP